MIFCKVSEFPLNIALMLMILCMLSVLDTKLEHNVATYNLKVYTKHLQNNIS